MKGLEDAENYARTAAAELAEVGINMNLAPVLDVAFNGPISIMSDRAFGHEPTWVSNLGAAVIEHSAAKQNHVGCQALSCNRPHNARLPS